MDVMIHHDDEEGIAFTAISARAIALFESRMGRGVKQFFCEGNPESVFGKLPKDWEIGIAETAKKILN